MSAENTIHAEDLALYHHELCGFCLRVRAVLERLGVSVEMRDIRRHPEYRQELIDGGGQAMVPCLRIHNEDGDDTWLYESADIVAYLIRRFGEAEQHRA
ncbi:glutaredoxin family protein [Arhodomonas sp. SL1]|uniref:glutaredoxin family protein n=1 Tax=Arhodomonas sp. SL1 TaxID=3425691 RepID=UPI003F882E6A